MPTGRTSDFRDFTIPAHVGQLDLRSNSGTLGLNNYRIVLNMSRVEERNLCRLSGFKKLFSDSQFGFLNQDLHNQLESCLSYFDSYSYHFSFEGGETGETAYPYFSPTQQTQEQLTRETSGPYCGYPDIFYTTYYPNTVDLTKPTMAWGRHGWPHTTMFTDGVCASEAPYEYGGSLYYLYTWRMQPGVITPGYPYGPLQPVMSRPYNYDQVYCGDTLHYWPGCREAVTLLAESSVEDGGRRLIAGTKSRIYALMESSANWMVLADGLGGAYDYEADCGTCSSRRFSNVRLGGFQLFTNDYDPVLYWQFDAPLSGCHQWRAQFVDDLLTLGITKVKVLGSWNGFAFYANIEEDGQRFPSTILWSDFNAPLSIVPGGNSLASRTDLGFGEEILRFEPLGSQARLYTDKAIYEVLLVGGDEGFRFLTIYRGPDTLKYRYSLINTGRGHVYLGETGIFVLEEYGRVPVRVEWMHKASGAIFVGVTATDLIGFPYLSPFGPINSEQCDQAVGFYDRERKVCWFSWPTNDNVCPNMSLTLNLQYGASSIVDEGFSTGVSYRPDTRQTILEWLRGLQVCDFNSWLSDLAKMGIPYDSSSPAFSDPPQYLFNETENPDLPSHPNSLCARLGNQRLEDLCGTDCNQSILVLASARDRTLKEYDPDIAYREWFIDQGEHLPCPYTATGLYVQTGYTSLVQSDFNKFGKNEEKLIRQASIDSIARVQTVPSLLNFQIGYANQVSCPTWKTATPKELKCLTEETAAAHLAANTRPDEFNNFPLHHVGIFLAYRFYILGAGGLSCFNEVKLEIKPKQGCW